MKRLGIDSIEAIFEFKTADGSAAGILRLSPAAHQGGAMRAWLLSTTLESLDGHEEKIGANRPTGAAYSRNFGGDNWADVRRKASAYADREPTVLVVGGAQAGLSIAARLNQVGVDTLVVEQWPRIGDSWRKRYHSLALHNSIHLNHLPYMEFPPTWPKYIPKDMLGLWFEFYAEVMEINCWTDTEFVEGTWNETAQRWTARLKRGDGTERVVRPRHLVFANGVSSYPMIPDAPGLQDFKGEVIHSEGFDSGADWTGKRAFILGTGSSANDIALDLHSHGVHTTLIQRGSTTVVSIDPSARLNEAIWDEGGPLEDCDLIVSAATPPLIVKAYKSVVKRMVELDKDMIEGLKRIGFKHDIGEDETGHQMKYFRRGGGYNLDAGSSALMIKGEIGLLQFEPQCFVRNLVKEYHILHCGKASSLIGGPNNPKLNDPICSGLAIVGGDYFGQSIKIAQPPPGSQAEKVGATDNGARDGAKHINVDANGRHDEPLRRKILLPKIELAPSHEY